LDNPKIPGPIDITAESIPAKKQQAQQITTKLKAQTLLEKSGISFCRYSILEIYNLLIFFPYISFVHIARPGTVLYYGPGA
jgi:hypothetical protein